MPQACSPPQQLLVKIHLNQKATREILSHQPSTIIPAELPFLIAGFMSFLFSVYLYFVLGEESAGIFVGLGGPSIHSLGTLILVPAAVTTPAAGSAVTAVVFIVGVFVFFLTVYGVVVAGGLQLTKAQSVAPDLDVAPITSTTQTRRSMSVPRRSNRDVKAS